MSSSLTENLPLNSPKDLQSAKDLQPTKPRKSWKQFIHRKNGKRVYVCNADSCGKSFNYLSSLVKHERIHRGERPYTCKVCDQRFVQSSNLKRHERTHTGEKTFGCTKCPKKFSTASNLRQHVQIHNNEIQRKHYDCQQCGRSYLYLSSLSKHVKFCDGIRQLSNVTNQTEPAIEPNLKKKVKVEEISTEIEQKSQPDSPSTSANEKMEAMLLPSMTQKFLQQNDTPMTMNLFLKSSPASDYLSYQNLAGPFISTQDQFLNKLMMQRASFNQIPQLYQQNMLSGSQFASPNLNLRGFNELPALLYQRQNFQNALLQQASLAFELGRFPLL